MGNFSLRYLRQQRQKSWEMQTLIASRSGGSNTVMLGLTVGTPEAAMDETPGKGDFSILLPAPLEDQADQHIPTEGPAAIYTAALLATLPAALPQPVLTANGRDVPADAGGMNAPLATVPPEGPEHDAGETLALLPRALPDVADASEVFALQDVRSAVAPHTIAAPSPGVEPAPAVPSLASDAVVPASTLPALSDRLTKIPAKNQGDAASIGRSGADVPLPPAAPADEASGSSSRTDLPSLSATLGETASAGRSRSDGPLPPAGLTDPTVQVQAPDAVPVVLGNASQGGFRLWQGAFVRDPTPPSAGDDPLVPGTSPASAAATPAVALANLADATLQPTLALQSGPVGDEETYTMVGMTSAVVPLPATTTALAMATSVASVHHLAGQLVQTLSHGSDGSTELALSPDELGHVRVTLQPDPQNPDRLVVMLTFERPETLDLFRRHADQLAEALREAGYTRADIGFGNAGTDSNNSSRRDASGAAAQPVSPDGVSGLDPENPALRLAASGTLDLRL